MVEKKDVKDMKKKIDDLKRDYNGLNEIYKYLRSDGAKQIDIEYILDEMDKDLKEIKSLQTEIEEIEESQTHLSGSMVEER